MSELLIALLPIALVAGLALLALLVPLKLLTFGAIALVAAGFVLGVPGGLGYHVLLRRELLRAGTLVRGWYWQPQRYHATLAPAALRRLRPWFFAGAFGFLLIMLGCGLAVTALAVWFRGDGAGVLA